MKLNSIKKERFSGSNIEANCFKLRNNLKYFLLSQKAMFNFSLNIKRNPPKYSEKGERAVMLLTLCIYSALGRFENVKSWKMYFSQMNFGYTNKNKIVLEK